MTTTEFLALPTREQDAIVAEKVMGWHAYKDPGPKATRECIPIACEICNSPYGHGVKPYSTDISAAWQVVEKMVERKWQVALLINDREPIVQMKPISQNYTEVIAYAKTHPLAICLAALKAVGFIKG